jgi:ABC-type multidrug transport system ATPase subunit
VSLTIGRYDSIALTGANGCGKTTLLRLLLGEEACDSGIVQVSSNAAIAYMPQIIHFDDENATVLETLRYAFDLTDEKARNILAGFRFKAPDVQKKIGVLSGGEKSRLKLCLLMQSKVNFLMLDEPTNHLDIESREWFEEAIADWEGTMLFISHDRYFLNKFASRIWSMEDGAITDFHGGFDEYLKAPASEKQSVTPVAGKKSKPPVKAIAQAQKPVSTDALICETEAALEKINAEIELDLTNSDYRNMGRLCLEKQRLEERLELLYSQWMRESGMEIRS